MPISMPTAPCSHPHALCRLPRRCSQELTRSLGVPAASMAMGAGARQDMRRRTERSASCEGSRMRWNLSSTTHLTSCLLRYQERLIQVAMFCTPKRPHGGIPRLRRGISAVASTAAISMGGEDDFPRRASAAMQLAALRAVLTESRFPHTPRKRCRRCGCWAPEGASTSLERIGYCVRHASNALRSETQSLRVTIGRYNATRRRVSTHPRPTSAPSSGWRCCAAQPISACWAWE